MRFKTDNDRSQDEIEKKKKFKEKFRIKTRE